MFTIGSAQIWYNIEVNVNITSENEWGNLSQARESIILSPEEIIKSTSDGTVIAQLIGDFSPFEQHPVFSEKYLAVPSQPLNNPIVQQGMPNWMLIDKSDVELDGTVCNKIGVSFEGFRNEYGACGNSPSSCLRNQLTDFYEEDIAKSNQGLAGKYLLSNFGSFDVFNEEEHNVVLGLEVEQIQTSLVTLTIEADNIRFIVNR